ncbi:MAG: hypothetical protein ACLFTG_10180, partial [Alphaproteobacteria bacterium]
EAGGLSGRPLLAPTTARLAHLRAALGPEQALVGVGGVGSAADVGAKLAAGADLVQLYTALIYEGVGLGRRLLAELDAVAAHPTPAERPLPEACVNRACPAPRGGAGGG